MKEQEETPDATLYKIPIKKAAIYSDAKPTPEDIKRSTQILQRLAILKVRFQSVLDRFNTNS